MARAMLGQWEEAAKDLHVASKLDYDEEIKAVLKQVQQILNSDTARSAYYLSYLCHKLIIDLTSQSLGFPHLVFRGVSSM